MVTGFQDMMLRMDQQRTEREQIEREDRIQREERFYQQQLSMQREYYERHA